MEKELLKCQGISKCYGEHWALKDCSFSLQRGSFNVIVGPSGCGKTTLLEIISGLQKETKGEIWLDDSKQTEIIRRKIAVVFQEPALFPYMSVEENILFGAPEDADFDIHNKAGEIAELLGLSERRCQRSDTLSGGEKQRTAIGRALMKGADLILMDEPFSALDAPLKQRLGDKLRSLQQQLSLTILYVTHDQNEAMRLADHLIVMKDGEIQQQGDPRSIYEHPLNTFVAGFIGNPAMNLLKAKVKGQKIYFHQEILPFPYEQTFDQEQEVIIGIRPSQIEYGSGEMSGVCKEIKYYGDQIQALIEWDGYLLQVLLPAAEVLPSCAGIMFDLRRCVFFDAENGGRIDLYS